MLSDMLPPKLNWRIRMNRTLAGLLVMISPLLLSACDALTYVGVSVEGQAICTLTIVKAGNVTMADEPLVEGFKFSVVMNKSLRGQTGQASCPSVTMALTHLDRSSLVRLPGEGWFLSEADRPDCGFGVGEIGMFLPDSACEADLEVRIRVVHFDVADGWQGLHLGRHPNNEPLDATASCLFPIVDRCSPVSKSRNADANRTYRRRNAFGRHGLGPFRAG
ncbi:MAG: hypothetical protein IPK97_08445 [Ahniella sp.]|nr:hypothetical protein [Ahniella sp.]